MKNILLSLLTVLAAAPAVGADEISQAAAGVVENNMPAMAVLRYNLRNEEDQTQPVEILAFCIDSRRGVYMTLGVTSRLPRTYLTDFRLLRPVGDEGEVQAELLGVDDETGVAFVASQALQGAPQVQLGDSSELDHGDVVFGLSLLAERAGYPARLGPARISAITRIPGYMYLVSGGPLSDMPGAPVFDVDGALVGVVSLSRQEPGMLFLGADEFAPLLANLPTGGRSVRRAWMGVLSVSGLSPENAALYGVGDRPAVQITSLLPNQPAAEAGLRETDIIVAVNGEPIEQFPDPELTARGVLHKIRRMEVGANVVITVLRDGQEVQVPVTLTAQPATPAEMPRTYNQQLGIAARNLTAIERHVRRLGDDEQAVVVDLVRPQSPAEGSIQPGDLIVRVAGSPTPNVQALSRQLSAAMSDASTPHVAMQVRRGAQTLDVEIAKP